MTRRSRTSPTAPGAAACASSRCGRKASGFQAVVDTIQRLRFCYVLPSSDPQPPCVPEVTGDQLQNIRAVRLTLTAKASRRDPQYPENGGYRTLERVAVVQLRNVALADEPGW